MHWKHTLYEQLYGDFRFDLSSILEKGNLIFKDFDEKDLPDLNYLTQANSPRHQKLTQLPIRP